MTTNDNPTPESPDLTVEGTSSGETGSARYVPSIVTGGKKALKIILWIVLAASTGAILNDDDKSLVKAVERVIGDQIVQAIATADQKLSEVTRSTRSAVPLSPLSVGLWPSRPGNPGPNCDVHQEMLLELHLDAPLNDQIFVQCFTGKEKKQSVRPLGEQCITYEFQNASGYVKLPGYIMPRIYNIEGEGTIVKNLTNGIHSFLGSYDPVICKTFEARTAGSSFMYQNLPILSSTQVFFSIWTKKVVYSFLILSLVSVMVYIGKKTIKYPLIQKFILSWSSSMLNGDSSSSDH